MDHGQLTMVADKCQWVFSEALLNACGQDVKFCRRQRVITPFRLGLALTATCASQRVETIADFHCGFNALFGTIVTYKASPSKVLLFFGNFVPLARRRDPVKEGQGCRWHWGKYSNRLWNSDRSV